MTPSAPPTWVLGLGLGILVACGGPGRATPTIRRAADDSLVVLAGQALLADTSTLRALVAPLPVDPELPGLYAEGPSPWRSPAGQKGRDAALAALRGAASDGLDPRQYAVERLHQEVSDIDSASPEQQARFELRLGNAILQYARHLHHGRIDARRLGWALRVPVENHPIAAAVRAALIGGSLADTLQALRPALRQYTSIREALARYRALADSGVSPLPVPEAPVKPLETWPGVPALRRTLAAFGDMPPDQVTSGPQHDSVTVRAVRHAQARFGLTTDGVIGPATIAALNVPPADRAELLALSLERLRWLPDLHGPRLLVVNIPTFQLWGWDDLPATRTPAIQMATIVGRALDRETPVLFDRMEHIVFRPYWNVPSSIARSEILPALGRDSTYLRKHDMEIVEGPGDDALVLSPTPEAIARVRRGQARIRQRPGPANALGLVKFIFPNAENVYLHDTPSVSLFERSRRDFSHGCVRVEAPERLAEWVLQDTPGWDRTRIREAMRGDRPRQVNLAVPIPVILFYTTALVQADGAVAFFPDIYRHDRRLAEALRASGSVP